MTRRHVSWILSFLLICAATAFAESNTPKKNTKADVKAYVERAAKYVAKNGPNCAELKEKDWMAGDYYVFVLGSDEKLICHPNASLVGKPASDIKDVNGKVVGTEIANAGKKKGGGWVEYMWPRPGTEKPVAKTTYAMHVKGPDGKTYIVGSGGYELK
jgi:cytochrome c